MKYAISDIHGDFRHFMKILSMIRFHKEDELYVLGDIMDKGMENLRLYRYIKDTPNMFLIKGNHEYLCERYLTGEISGDVWDRCGGEMTRKEVDQLSGEGKAELHDYLEGLPIYLLVESGGREFFLTHSGYRVDFCVKDPKSGLVNIEESVKLALEYDQEKYLFSDDIHYIPSSVKFDRRLIVGHYPTLSIDGYHRAQIYHGKKFIDIDTGNERRECGGKLSCLCLSNGREYYI